VIALDLHLAAMVFLRWTNERFYDYTHFSGGFCLLPSLVSLVNTSANLDTEY
jgi:hypothetical protein